jgi:hypothetical protein
MACGRAYPHRARGGQSLGRQFEQPTLPADDLENFEAAHAMDWASSGLSGSATKYRDDWPGGTETGSQTGSGPKFMPRDKRLSPLRLTLTECSTVGAKNTNMPASGVTTLRMR